MVASAVLPRIIGRDERNICAGVLGLRWRGTEDDGALARPESPRRWTLPITALRVMPPSSPAIWLADRPSPQSFLSRSTRSSVQDMGLSIRRSNSLAESRSPAGDRLGRPDARNAPDMGLRRLSAARDVV